MAQDDNLLVKIGLTALAVWALILPEGVSSLVGFGTIAAIWGFDALGTAEGDG